MIENFKKIFENYNFQLEEKILEQFVSFSKILLEENEKYNLTRITSENELIEKHFVDSCFLASYMKEGKLLDIGSGAGFPGIVLAILFENIQFTLVESIGKKANFIKKVADSLNLKNVEVINDRAENLNRKNYYDYATARAVALLPIVVEYCVPFLKVEGKFLSQKGPRYKEEIEKTDFTYLGVSLKDIKEFTISESKRYILEIEKIEDKIKVPRKNLRKLYS